MTPRRDTRTLDLFAAVLRPIARRATSVIADDDLLGVEARDALERACGGRWRESQHLLPGEKTIEDERLS